VRVDVEIADPRFLEEDAVKVTAALRRGLEWVGQELSSAVVSNAPVKSARLRSAIHPTGVITAGSAGLELKVGFMQGSNATVLKYARVRDEGTGYLPGGVIRAKTDKGLFFPVAGAAFTASGVGGLGYGAAKLSGLASGTEWRRVMEVRQEGSGYLTKTAEAQAPALIDKYVGMALRDL